MSALVPYVGKERSGPKARPVVMPAKLGPIGGPMALADTLGPYSQKRALELFRAGHDTASMAWLLACTEAAAANGLARARDAERAR